MQANDDGVQASETAVVCRVERELLPLHPPATHAALLAHQHLGRSATAPHLLSSHACPLPAPQTPIDLPCQCSDADPRGEASQEVEVDCYWQRIYQKCGEPYM